MIEVGSIAAIASQGELHMSANDQTMITALAQASAAAHPVPDRGHVNNFITDATGREASAWMDSRSVAP